MGGRSTLRIDFGYRSEHAFATPAIAITEASYGATPAYSYYDGCSDGGREALMVAQRYPDDFDGILAFNQTALNGFEEAHLATIDFRPDGSTILPASKLSTLHAAVIAKCANPQLNDKTIQDPRDCGFDPTTIQCPASTDTATCLTSEQIDVVRKAYTMLLDHVRTPLILPGLAQLTDPDPPQPSAVRTAAGNYRRALDQLTQEAGLAA